MEAKGLRSVPLTTIGQNKLTMAVGKAVFANSHGYYAFFSFFIEFILEKYYHRLLNTLLNNLF
jgi:hypothetical protein